MCAVDKIPVYVDYLCEIIKCYINYFMRVASSLISRNIVMVLNYLGILHMFNVKNIP